MKKLIEKCTTETSRRALKADLRRLEDRREAMNRKREEQTARQRAARPTAPGDKKKSARFESDVAHGYSRWIANRKERGRQRMEARRRSRTGQYAKEKVEEERKWHELHDQENTVQEDEFEVDDPDQAQHTVDIETDAILEGETSKSGTTTLKRMVAAQGKHAKKYRPLTPAELEDCIMREQSVHEERRLTKPIERSWKNPPSRLKMSFRKKKEKHAQRRKAKRTSRIGGIRIAME